jgi:hypothetical protein
MNATANEIIGSLVYRTAQGLNRNAKFLSDIRGYRFWPSLVKDDKIHLWHFPGTQQEISQTFKSLNEQIYGRELKFPALLNYQGVSEQREFSFGVNLNRYNLAIVAPVLDAWSTQQRDEQVHKLVLRPIEEEFIRQIRTCRYLVTPLGDYPYTRYYIPTTGNALNSIMKMNYGDYIDAIEFPDFQLKVKNGICVGTEDRIIEESRKVTDEINNIIKV